MRHGGSCRRVEAAPTRGSCCVAKPRKAEGGKRQQVLSGVGHRGTGPKSIRFPVVRPVLHPEKKGSIKGEKQKETSASIMGELIPFIINLSLPLFLWRALTDTASLLPYYSVNQSSLQRSCRLAGRKHRPHHSVGRCQGLVGRRTPWDGRYCCGPVWKIQSIIGRKLLGFVISLLVQIDRLNK